MTNAIDAPAYAITVNGQNLSRKWLGALLSLKVDHELNVPAMFEMKFSSINMGSEQYQGLDLDFFEPGASVTISMGIDKPTKILSGEISGIDPGFGDCSEVTIRGYDKLYRMSFGTKWKVFAKKSDNQIAADIAGKLGFSASTDQTGVKLAYMLQNNISDLEFLRKRAKQLQFEIWVEDNKFFFKKSREGQGSVATLNYPNDLDELDLSLKTLEQGSKVTVMGWDVKTKKIFSGSDGDKDKMGGKQSGYQVSGKFPDSAITLTDLTVNDAAGAKKLAKAESAANLSSFIEGEGRGSGNAKLLAGKNIIIEGLSKRFAGLYYITSSTHLYNLDEGYQTTIKLRRTGV